jgi:hypothetical protein
MNDTSETPLNGTIDPLKAEQELNLIRYKRAFARRNFIKNVGLAGAGIAAGAVIQGCSDDSTSTNPKAQSIPERSSVSREPAISTPISN